MTADSRSPAAPIAIRITRPYATEDEYLEHELDTLTRASITLVGAQPRAEGVVLRFEVVLPSGHILIRGEGRVVGFKTNAHQGMGGLSLRFTRLDMRSKALVDKAAALREQRRPSARPSASEPPAASAAAPAPRLSVPPPLRPSVPPPSRPSRVPPPLPVQGRASSIPPPLPAAARLAHAMAMSATPEPPRVATPLPPRVPTPIPPRMPTPAPPRMATPPPPASPVSTSLPRPDSRDPELALAAPRVPTDVNRDGLLDRLRERARRLDPSFVANLLDPSRWSS